MISLQQPKSDFHIWLKEQFHLQQSAFVCLVNAVCLVSHKVPNKWMPSNHIQDALLFTRLAFVVFFNCQATIQNRSGMTVLYLQNVTLEFTWGFKTDSTCLSVTFIKFHYMWNVVTYQTQSYMCIKVYKNQPWQHSQDIHKTVIEQQNNDVVFSLCVTAIFRKAWMGYALKERTISYLFHFAWNN